MTAAYDLTSSLVADRRAAREAVAKQHRLARLARRCADAFRAAAPPAGPPRDGPTDGTPVDASTPAVLAGHVAGAVTETPTTGNGRRPVAA